MDTMSESIKNHIFENIALLQSVFNDNAYQKLSTFKESNNLNSFKEILELILTDEILDEINNILHKNFLTKIPKNSNFLGRENELKNIKNSLKKNQVIVIYGAGGIGKTYVAREFLNRELDNYRSVGWINYRDSFKTSLIKELNEKYNFIGTEEDVYKQVLEELNKLDGVNLLVIDSLDEKSEMKYINDLPSNIHVLISSREKEENFHTIKINHFDIKTAEELFTKFYKRNLEGIEKLLEKLNYSPLLIEMTAKSLESKKLDILDILNKKLAFDDESKYIKNLIDFQKLDKRQMLILKWFAILPSIELELDNLVEYFVIEDTKLFDEDLKSLVTKGLLLENDNRFKLHQNIQKSLLKYDKPLFKESQKIINYFTNLLDKSTSNNPIEGIKYIKFAVSILNNFTINNKDLIMISHHLATTYMMIGEVTKSLEIEEPISEIAKKLLKPNSIDLLSIYNVLANIKYRNGDLRGALTLQEKVITILKQQKDFKNLSILYSNISVTYCELKEFNTALKYQKDSITMKEKYSLGKELLGSSYTNLSVIYYSMYKSDNTENTLEDALIYAKKAIAIETHALDNNHPEKAKSYSQTAKIYLELNNLNQAIFFANKALDIYKVIFDEGNIFIEDVNQLIIDIESQINPYIQTIQIENFKLLKEPKAFKFDKNINIIIGENSSGKTSLLQAISLGLLPAVNNDDRQIKTFEEFITKGKSFSKIEISSDNFTKIVQLNKDSKEVQNDETKVFVLSYGVNFFTPYEETNYDLIIDRILSPNPENHYFTSPIFKNYNEKFYDPLTILNKLENDKYINEENENDIEDFKADYIAKINKFIGSKIKLEKVKTTYYFSGFDEKYSLDELSEGYRRYILLISDILLRVYTYGETPQEVKGVILIDEFDNHLHPDWQNGIVSTLKEVFPSIQFILTTHNPMSILDRKPWEIINLETTKEGVQTKYIELGTENIDISIVLLKYFKVKSLVGETMRKNLEEFIRLQKQDKQTSQEKERVQEIREALKDTVASNFIYSEAYYEFLKFIKNNPDIDFKDDYEELTDEKRKELLEKIKKKFKKA